MLWEYTDGKCLCQNNESLFNTSSVPDFVLTVHSF